MKKLILIDGNSLFFRAYYATAYSGRGLMKNKEGLYTNALFAFVNMFEKILEEDYSHILVAFDTDKPTKRHLAYKEYKAGREKMPEEMAVQIPLIHEYLKHKKIAELAIEGFEADDIIGTFAEKAKTEMAVEIYSSDKDLLQLIDDNVTVKLIRRGLSDVVEMTPESFYQEYGISHQYMVDLKGLMGDSSDNIPGLPGVGEKTAVRLIKEYGSLEQIMKNRDQIKGKLGETLRNEADKAYLSYDLSKIETDIQTEINFAKIKKANTDLAGLVEFYRKLDLHSFIKRIDSEELDLFSYQNHVEEEVPITSIIIESKTQLKAIIKDNLAIHLEYFENNYHTSELLGFGMSDGKKSYYVSAELALETKEFTDFLASETPKITYDYKAFKVGLLWRGFDLNGVVYDMLLASYLSYSQLTSSDFKVICGHFNYNEVNYDDVIYGRGAKKRVPELAVLAEHIAAKATAIYRLKNQILAVLKADDLLALNELELEVSTTLALTEYRGIKVDLTELKQQKGQLFERIKILEDQIHQYANKSFNIRSPKQLGEVLFDDLKLKSTKKTKTQRYSTNVEVLNSLIDEHPIIKPILEYRQVTKLYSTYIEGIENSLFEDQKLHTIYAQAQTATGRLSSLEPNLQNIPVRTEEGRQIRKLFVPSEGYSFISADYSQIELRVLAHLSKSQALIDDFNHDLDIHSQTAMKVFNTKEVSPYERFRAKAVNFGIIYGISAWSLAEDINTSVKEAQEFIDRYFEIYPEIKIFMDQTVKFAKENGFVKTIMNRRRYIPELKNPLHHIKAFGRRTAMNAPIQGSAADIIKKAMVDLLKYIKENKLQSKILLQVHDELIIEVPQTEIQLMKKVLPEIMNKTVSLAVKLKTDSKVGNTWYELD